MLSVYFFAIITRKSIITIVQLSFSQNSLTTFFNQRVEQRLLKAIMKNNCVRTCKKQALQLGRGTVSIPGQNQKGWQYTIFGKMLFPSAACM